MSKLDFSKAAFSGVALTSLEYILEAPEARSVTKAAVNGSLLTISDLLVQSLGSGSVDDLRTFLYMEHESLTTAVVFSIIQELKELFIDSGYEQYQTVFPKIVANLFMAAGSISIGGSVNRMVGMNDNSLMSMLSGDGISPVVPKVSRSRAVWNE